MNHVWQAIILFSYYSDSYFGTFQILLIPVASNYLKYSDSAYRIAEFFEGQIPKKTATFQHKNSFVTLFCFDRPICMNQHTKKLLQL